MGMVRTEEKRIGHDEKEEEERGKKMVEGEENEAGAH